MARIELAPEIRDDFDRILDHLTERAVEDAPGRIREIIQAVDVLQHNPLIGRPVSADTRELIIGRRARGYVALYRHIEPIDTVFVLAIRSQREAGYADLSSVEFARRLIVAVRWATNGAGRLATEPCGGREQKDCRCTLIANAVAALQQTVVSRAGYA